jgi:hypothetical protein
MTTYDKSSPEGKCVDPYLISSPPVSTPCSHFFTSTIRPPFSLLTLSYSQSPLPFSPPIGSHQHPFCSSQSPTKLFIFVSSSGRFHQSWQDRQNLPCSWE